MELTFEELEKSFAGIGTFRGGYEVIRKEVYEDLEDDSYDDEIEAAGIDADEAISDHDIKIEIVSRILEENLDFGPLSENLDTDQNRDARFEKRYDLLDPIADMWVEGEISSVKEAQAELDQSIK